MQTELAFWSVAEKLKTELRHSWLSNGRQESVAEHSWRLAMMAMRYAHRLAQPVDMAKCLKMALVHDLAEAKTGDIHALETQTIKAQKAKYQQEYAAMRSIQEMLHDVQGDELFQIWQEYEDQQTYESRFVKALDKVEVFVQHNEANVNTWEEREKYMVFQEKWLRKYCVFDPFLNQLCDAVIAQSIEKLKNAGEDVEALAQAASDEKYKKC